MFKFVSHGRNDDFVTLLGHLYRGSLLYSNYRVRDVFAQQPCSMAHTGGAQGRLDETGPAEWCREPETVNEAEQRHRPCVYPGQPCAVAHRCLASQRCPWLRSRARRWTGGWGWASAVAAMLLCNIMDAGAFGNEMCLMGNCSSARHLCQIPPRDSWLAIYVPSIMTVCQCPNVTMAGRACNVPCPGGHSNPCSGHGECLYGSATCVCDFGWQGDRHCLISFPIVLAVLERQLSSLSLHAPDPV